MKTGVNVMTNIFGNFDHFVQKIFFLMHKLLYIQSKPPIVLPISNTYLCTYT
jgi:hypothetical protein